MVVRARDIERHRQYNKLVAFTDAAAGGQSITATWGGSGVVIGSINPGTGQQTVAKNIENVSGRLYYAVELDFFKALNKGDPLTITLPAGTITATCAKDGTPYGAISLDNVSSNDTGPITDGDAVTVTSGSLSADISAWARVDDSTISDVGAFSLIEGELARTGMDTSRILFIRTRADSRITVDHEASIGSIKYAVRSIQELPRNELRIALVRVAES